MGLQGMRSVKRKVRGIRAGAQDDVKEAVESGAENAARAMQGMIVQRNAVYTTNLYRAIGVRSESQNRIKISAPVPYAAYVEFGTGSRRSATTPPKFMFESPQMSSTLIRNITNWVMNKPAFYGPRDKWVALRIAQTIAEKGTHAQPFMRPVWHSHKPRIIGRARARLKRTVRQA